MFSMQHSENCQSVKNDTEKENQLLREENAKLHYEIVCLKQQPVKAATRTGDPFDSYLPFVSFSEVNKLAEATKVCANNFMPL